MLIQIHVANKLREVNYDVVAAFNGAARVAVTDALHQVASDALAANTKYGMVFADDASYLFYLTAADGHVTVHVGPRIRRAHCLRNMFHLFLNAAAGWSLGLSQ